MKRSSHRVVVALAVIALLPGIACSGPDAAPSADQLRAALERGITWQAAQEMRRVDAIFCSLWISELVAAQLPELSAQLRARSLHFYQKRWLDELYLRKLVGGKEELPDDKTEMDRQSALIRGRLAEGTIGRSGVGPQDFLLLSLYVNDPYVRGNFDPVFDALFARPLPRYGVTHQLLALHFLQREKGFPEAKIQEAIDRFSEPVVEAIDHDLLIGVYTDLMAERMTVLAMVGKPLKPAWLAFAIENQRENGQWEVEPLSVSPASLASDMDQHITVLSLYALARSLSDATPAH